ncbi:MAG: PAS domain S-box protein [Burkholderiales bacterium]|nr:PAS domain S-box protein [Burkholderiales bacterium]
MTGDPSVEGAEARLREAIFAQTPDAIIFADCEGVIRMWNRGAEVLFGFPAEDVIGGSLDVIIPERFRQAHWTGFRRAVASGHARHGDRVRTTRAVHRFGHTLYVDLSFALVKDQTGSVLGSVAVGRDGSDRYLAERALRERLAELERHAG